MTDAERMLALLKAYPQGVHSHELRSRGISGNPSQRAADLEAKGHEIERKREYRNGRPGCRYRLVRLGAGTFVGPGKAGLPGNDREVSANTGVSPGSNQPDPPASSGSSPPDPGEYRLFGGYDTHRQAA